MEDYIGFSQRRYVPVCAISIQILWI